MRPPPAILRTLLSLTAVASCERLTSCKGGLAEVTEAKGRVERDFDQRRETWQAAQSGETLDRGDGLRTGPKSSAMLRMRSGGTLHVRSDTTLRLLLSGDVQDGAPAADLEVQTGSAVLEAGKASLPLRTRFGSAVLQPGARVELSKRAEGVHYQVVLGSAAFAHEDGQSAKLNAGQGITVGIGMAVLDTVGVAAPPVGVAAAADKPGTEAAQTAAAPDTADEDPSTVHAVVRGDVRRREKGGQEWAALAAGSARLGAGDELEVHERGEADLSRGHERATLRRGKYEIGAPGAALVRASEGKLMVVADQAVVVVEVPGGMIVAEPAPGGSRADVVVNGSDGSADVVVLAGRVKTTSAEGEEQLAAGERSSLTAGEHAPPAEGASPGAGATPGTSTSAERERTPKKSVEHAELVVPAGEVFRVYDPAPPTVIGFSLGKRCPQGAELQIRGLDPVQGKGQLNALVGPGIRPYRVLCSGGDKSATIWGTVRVLRSDGTRRPVTTPARNDVELDGRQYTLMYQNLKPILQVSWPKAPSAASYQLRLQGPDGQVRSLRSGKPRIVVEPSQLGEGVHVLRFETAGGARSSSKDTKVNLVFDNAAPMASLKEPPPAGFAAGARTSVAGVAVAGSSASVNGKPIPIDAEGRFAGEAALQPGQRTLIVRFTHPKHGTRYYLRRAAAGQP